MLKQIKLLLFITIVISAISCNKKQGSQVPIGAFFNPPGKSQFHISPDGKYISYLKRVNGKQNIYLEDLASGTEKPATSFVDHGMRIDHFWTYNNQIIATQYVRDRNAFQMMGIDINTLKARTLLSAGRVNVKVLSRNFEHPDVLTFSMNQRDSSVFDVYRLNIKTGNVKMYLKNPGNITQWYTDLDGTIRLEKASDGVNETILFRHNENSPFKPILQNNFKNLVEPIAFTGVKSNFYARSNVNRDKTALVEINGETGKEEKLVYGTDKADIDEVAYSKSRHRLEAVSWQEARPCRHFFDNGIREIYEDLHHQLPNNEIKIVDRDTSEQKFLINAYSDRNPGSYYLYIAKEKKLIKLADMNPGINPNDMCEMKPVSFKAGDGTLINGYLTLPKGGSTNLPVVVIPHSDPWNRNNWGYNADVQFLANRGYAVFQVNHRGSNGYGKAFFTAGFKQIGGVMQQDITDGVKWLIGQKIADPKRIAIFGSGFGGFSALYGVSFHPGLYNCAAVQFPLINFFTFFKDVPPFFKPKLSMLYEMFGRPETDADKFRAISPVFNAGRIKVPLLIVQGSRDPNASINELNRFVSEVRKNGVPITYILKDNNHDHRSPMHDKGRLAMYTQLENFLTTNLDKR